MSPKVQPLETNIASVRPKLRGGEMSASVNRHISFSGSSVRHTAAPVDICDADTNSEKSSRPEKLDGGEVAAGMLWLHGDAGVS